MLEAAVEEERASPHQPINLFFALKPDVSTAARVHQLAHQHRVQRGMSGPTIPSHRLHITLLSVGTGTGLVPDEIIEMANLAGDAAVCPAFDISLDRAASFARPNGKRPYVLLGDDGVIDVMMLQRSLIGAIFKFREFGQTTRFVPHMTLLYDGMVEQSQHMC